MLNPSGKRLLVRVRLSVWEVNTSQFSNTEPVKSMNVLENDIPSYSITFRLFLLLIHL